MMMKNIINWGFQPALWLLSAEEEEESSSSADKSREIVNLFRSLNSSIIYLRSSIQYVMLAESPNLLSFFHRHL